MKKIILQLCIVAGLVVTAAATGYSQVSQSYRATIPFDFTVKSTTMKAGDYRLNPILSTSGIGALQLLDVSHNKSRLLGVVKPGDVKWDEDQNEGRLIFIRDGDHYTLAGIETSTFQMRMPKVTASAQVLTKNAAAPSTVSVALQ